MVGQIVHIGDDMSNRDKIHLEPTWIKDVWEEYSDNMKKLDVPYLSVNDVGKIFAPFT